MKIFLIERLRIDELENDHAAALRYVPFGYVEGATKAKQMSELSHVHGTGWPIEKGKSMPLYRATQLNRIDPL